MMKMIAASTEYEAREGTRVHYGKEKFTCGSPRSRANRVRHK